MDKKRKHGQPKPRLKIVLAGNPNVGKSTVFNTLTGMNCHTGNWAGKTVSDARAGFETPLHTVELIDTPGAYSLCTHSKEEEAARDILCFGGADIVIVVCDASCLERNMCLLTQITEITERIIVCVNLLDEAERRGIKVDLDALSARLGLPVIGTNAHDKRTLRPLLDAIDDAAENKTVFSPAAVEYPAYIEEAARTAEQFAQYIDAGTLSRRFLALRLAENDSGTVETLKKHLCPDEKQRSDFEAAVSKISDYIKNTGADSGTISEEIAAAHVRAAERLCAGTVSAGEHSRERDRKADRILTGRVTGFPVMILLLILIFWITVTGANYPSGLLSGMFEALGEQLYALFGAWGAPEWVTGIVLDGAYRVLTWVISVMLPPMAIFFPLFTILEDIGYLPRIAYNLDCPFRKCHTCGKQALTMCMGFGCNAVGITGCRIIDSPRERIIAMLTNNFSPCNGRFPMIIAMLCIFLTGGEADSLLSSVLLAGFTALSVFMSLLVSRILSATLLKGTPSAFTLELPPYRRPQLGKIITRSVLDRTLKVLGRAVIVAAPAGVIIWLCANIPVNGSSVLDIITQALDPFARFFGLDGVILAAFILGFPANETVLPIMIMAYTASSTITETPGLDTLSAIFAQNGWSAVTAVNVILFSMMHWPCSTALLTLKKESGSVKWTVLGFVIPTACGLLCCLAVKSAAGVMGYL